MIVLLPVSRYRVHYEVASGRPYSFFERFVLEAINKGSGSLDHLERTFRMHRRPVIETLVTLMQAGWVAIGSDGQRLLLTAAGKAAVGSDELPKSIFVANQTDYLVGERVQGQIARNADVKFHKRSDLRSVARHAATLPPANIQHSVDPGIVVPLLSRQEGQWIRACGPVDIMRDGADFVVVDVNVGSGTVTGLPTKWIPLLQEDLVDRARWKERQLLQEGVTYIKDKGLSRLVRRDPVADSSVDDPDEWPVDIDSRQIVVGAQNHDQLLLSCLEGAESYVCIACWSLDDGGVQKFEPAIREALARGVDIDVVWGFKSSTPSHSAAIERLKKLEWDSQHAANSGRLTLGAKPSGSHAMMVLADVASKFEIHVGSHDWLALGSHLDVSLSLTNLGPVSRVSLLTADLLANDERLSAGSGPTRLRRMVSEVDRVLSERREPEVAPQQRTQRPIIDTSESGNSTIRGPRVRMLVGRQHLAVLPLLSRSATSQIVVGSSSVDLGFNTAVKHLAAALERGCSKVDIRFGSVSASSDFEDLLTGLQKLGASVTPTEGLRSNVIAIDTDLVAISSFDWFGGLGGGAAPYASDVGFVVHGPDIALQLLDKLGMKPALARPELTGYYVSSFEIQDLRSVRQVAWHVEPSSCPGWHVLVGDNGSGKTTVLRSIALALLGPKRAQALRQDWGRWPRGPEPRVSIRLVQSSEPENHSSFSLGERSLVWRNSIDGYELEGESLDDIAIVSVGYGPFRRFSGGDPEYEKQLSSSPELARHLSLFNESVALTESLTWLKELRFKELEGDAEAALLLDRVSKLVNDSGLLPAGVRLHDVSSSAVTFKDESGVECDLESLSDGFRSVLSLVFDIVRQLAREFGSGRIFDPMATAVVIAPCIVLIDEVDAHLHPMWQRTIGHWFYARFPRTQFIVTTHSPLICHASEHGTIYRLPNPADIDDAGGMLEGAARARLVFGNILDGYASGAFGDGVTRSDSSQKHLQRLASLNSKELGEGLTPTEATEQVQLRATLPSTPYASSSEVRQP